MAEPAQTFLPGADSPANHEAAPDRASAELPTTQDIDVGPIPRVNIHVYAETPGFSELWARISGDRRMAAVQDELSTGGIQAAIHRYRGQSTPSLIIVETNADKDQLTLEVDMLAEVCDPETQVMLVGHCNDIQLYLQMIDIGVANYLVFPVEVPVLLKAIADLYNVPGAEKIGRTSAVIGASGGVGASCVAQNLAWHLSVSGDRDVLLVDMDLGFGSASLNLDVEANQGLAEVIDQAERLDAGMLDRVLVKRGAHLNLLTTTAGLETDRQFDPFSVDRMIETASKHIPIIVLDVPHIWADWTQRALTAADEVAVVAEPTLGSLRNAAALIQRLGALRPNDAPPRLILNRVGMPRRDEIAPKEIAALLKTAPASQIPYDAKLFGRAASSGKLAIEVAPRKPVGKAVVQLAEALYPNRQQHVKTNRLRAPWRR